MPYTIQFEPKYNCIFIKFYGRHDIADLEKTVEDILNSAEYQPGMNILRDLRDQSIPEDVTFKSISETAKHVMQNLDFKLGKCKWAAVTGDAQSFAKVHQFIVTGRLGNSPVERKVFNEFEQALAWLDLPADFKV